MRSTAGSVVLLLILMSSGALCNLDAAADTHFLGYKAKGLGTQILTLEDQFGLSFPTELRHKLYVNKMFFNPVDKNGEGIPEPDFHLAAYKIKSDPIPLYLVTVEVLNQFGQQKLDVKLIPKYLLVPTRKEGHPEPSGLDHYRCYQAHPMG